MSSRLFHKHHVSMALTWERDVIFDLETSCKMLQDMEDTMNMNVTWTCRTCRTCKTCNVFEDQHQNKNVVKYCEGVQRVISGHPTGRSKPPNKTPATLRRPQPHSPLYGSRVATCAVKPCCQCCCCAGYWIQTVCPTVHVWIMRINRCMLPLNAQVGLVCPKNGMFARRRLHKERQYGMSCAPGYQPHVKLANVCSSHMTRQEFRSIAHSLLHWSGLRQYLHPSPKVLVTLNHFAKWFWNILVVKGKTTRTEHPRVCRKGHFPFFFAGCLGAQPVWLWTVKANESPTLTHVGTKPKIVGASTLLIWKVEVLSKLTEVFFFTKKELNVKFPTVWAMEKQRREKSANWRNHRKKIREEKESQNQRWRCPKFCVFSMLCGSRGWTSRFAKAAGSHLGRWNMKNCTPLWCEALKCWKNANSCGASQISTSKW